MAQMKNLEEICVVLGKKMQQADGPKTVSMPQ
jgi:hypothetical protein